MCVLHCLPRRQETSSFSRAASGTKSSFDETRSVRRKKVTALEAGITTTTTLCDTAQINSTLYGTLPHSSSTHSTLTCPLPPPCAVFAVYAEAPAGPLGQAQAAQPRRAVPTWRPRRQEAKGREQASRQTRVNLTKTASLCKRTRGTPHIQIRVRHPPLAILAVVLCAMSSVSLTSRIRLQRSRRPSPDYHPRCWYTTSTARSKPTETCCPLQTRLTPWSDSKKRGAL